jgi:phosphate transport system permease protein
MAQTTIEQEQTARSAREQMASTLIARSPSVFDVWMDRLFRGLTLLFAALTIVLVLYILVEVGGSAAPAIQQYGLSFITSTTWDVNKSRFGVLPEIWGTLYSSVLALLLGGFFGVSIAIFLTQDFMSPKLEVIFKNIVELLAAIPSVVYGLWGIFVVIPAIRPVADWLHQHLGWIPLFGTSLSGPGMLPAALVLTIMVLPTISAISRDALSSVPPRGCLERPCKSIEALALWAGHAVRGLAGEAAPHQP